MGRVMNEWVRLAMPEQMAAAENRKAAYEALLARYEAKNGWGKFLMRQREFLHIPTIRQLAAAPIEDHLEFVQREVVFQDGSRAPYYKTSFAIRG